MKEDLVFHRKHYSHSIKRILHPLHLSNPESPKALTVPLKQPKSPRKNYVEAINQRVQANSYEKMVDDLMRKHVQEHQIPLQMTKLLIKRHYKNYRIINSDSKKEKDHFLLEENQSEVLPKESHVKRDSFGKVKTEEGQQSEVTKSFREKKRLKGNPLELPSILKYDKQIHLQSAIISNKSILSQQSMKSAIQDREIEEMKSKFIKRYMKIHTES